MIRRALILIPALAALTACGTPQEQCITASTRDLRTVDRLIAETKTNLSRGYAYETEEITRTEWVICEYIPVPPATPGGPVPPPKPRYCLDDVTDTIRREVAIDPGLEQRKLAGLQSKRKELGRAASAAVIACQAKYPDEG
jgi:hypothetical protein